jgi:GT2 family glycosyltransferase
MQVSTISVVTPTFRRPGEVLGLLENLRKQSVLPAEAILVDGASPEETATESAVARVAGSFPFKVLYIRHGGALIDDDVRLESDFLENILKIFENDTEKEIGGIVGYRTNCQFLLMESQRWRWYKRLKLLSIYEPGRYDYKCGYPINNNMQLPFTGTRPVDFMTTACAVWRREVFDAGLRFDLFFRDYGMLEDAHFSLRAGQKWKLLQCGDAHCEELHSPNGRVDRRLIGFKSVVNYYFVFRDIAGPLRLTQNFRFWRYQAFEFFRIGMSAIRRWNWNDVLDLRGRLDGISHIVFTRFEK